MGGQPPLPLGQEPPPPRSAPRASCPSLTSAWTVSLVFPSLSGSSPSSPTCVEPSSGLRDRRPPPLSSLANSRSSSESTQTLPLPSQELGSIWTTLRFLANSREELQT